MVYATLLNRLQEEPLKGIVGPDYVTGSNLPSHSDIHISCLTGLKIQVQPKGINCSLFSLVQLFFKNMVLK